MPMGKGYGKKGMGGDMMMKGMKDGSRHAVPMTNMNGRIDPGMTPKMSQTKTMGKMPMKKGMRMS